MTEDRQNAETPELNTRLHAAVEALRAEPAPRDSWRQALLARVASDEAAEPVDPPAHRPLRRSRRREWLKTALAAGLAGLLIGAAGTYSVLHWRSRSITDSISSAGSAPATEYPLSVRFTLVAPHASHVALVGDFNGWNAHALPMQRLADGQTWEVQATLDPGRYTYAFVVDGHLARDPAAPESGDDDFGSANSVLLVPGTHGAGL